MSFSKWFPPVFVPLVPCFPATDRCTRHADNPKTAKLPGWPTQGNQGPQKTLGASELSWLNIRYTLLPSSSSFLHYTGFALRSVWRHIFIHKCPPSGPSQTEPVHPHPHHSLFVLYDWECKPINLTEIATTCSSFFAVRSKTSRHVKSPADQPQNYSRRRALWAWHQLSVTQITVRFMYLQDYRADP